MPVNPYVKGGVDVPVLDGGTGASTAGDARTNLDVLNEVAHDLLDHTGLTGVADLTIAAHVSLDHYAIPMTLLNVGTTTAAVFDGDLAAGDGTREMLWDASTAILALNGAASTISSDNTITLSSTGILSLDSSTNVIQTNATSLTADAALGITATAATLTLTGAGVSIAGGSSEIDLTTTDAVDVNSAAGTWDSSSTLNFEAATSGSFNVTTGGLTLSTTTSGDLTLQTTTAGDILLSGAAEIDLTAVGLMDFNAGANLDIDVTGTFDVLASSTFNIGGTGGSNVSVTSGNLSLSTLISGNVLVDAVGTVEINSSAAAINIGNDTAAFAINIGTGAAARTITIGNVTGATALALNTGTGGLQVNSLPVPLVLGQAIGVDLTAIGDTTLLTVPAGKTAIVLGVMIRPTNVSSANGDAVINLGTNSTAFDNILNGATLTGLDATTEVHYAAPTNGTYHAAAAAEVVTFRVATGDSGTTLDATIELVGYLV